jgi:hypothetical protein
MDGWMDGWMMGLDRRGQKLVVIIVLTLSRLASQPALSVCLPASPSPFAFFFSLVNHSSPSPLASHSPPMLPANSQSYPSVGGSAWIIRFNFASACSMRLPSWPTLPRPSQPGNGSTPDRYLIMSRRLLGLKRVSYPDNFG